jgi:hypothetical protein
MAFYTTPGFTCRLNQVEFSNFSYTGTGVFATGGSDEVPVSQVRVQTDATSTYIGLNFLANWVFIGQGTGDVHISYTAQDVFGGTVYQVSSGFASSGQNYTQAPSATCTAPCNVGVGGFANNTKSLLVPTAGPYDTQLADVLTGTSFLSISHLSIITSRVFTQGDVFPTVPEPGTILLSLGGVLGLLVARRAQARRQS